MNRTIRRGRVMIFDSGRGGLSVVRALRTQLPDAELVYAADNAAFPYGAWSEVKLVRRILSIMKDLIAQVEPDCVVIACNTASTLALDSLREEFRVPFVGTVPAIKPAAAQSKSGVVGVLATPGTARREYTRTLIHTYAYHCKVLLHGAPQLAQLAEYRLDGRTVDLQVLRAEIAPVFKTRNGGKTDTVVLGCTHYPLLLEELRQAAPWPVAWIDPAAAIARRTAFILADGAGGAVARSTCAIAADTVVFTHAPQTSPKMPGGFAEAGFDRLHGMLLPAHGKS